MVCGGHNIAHFFLNKATLHLLYQYYIDARVTLKPVECILYTNYNTF